MEFDACNFSFNPPFASSQKPMAADRLEAVGVVKVHVVLEPVGARGRDLHHLERADGGNDGVCGRDGRDDVLDDSVAVNFHFRRDPLFAVVGLRGRVRAASWRSGCRRCSSP